MDGTRIDHFASDIGSTSRRASTVPPDSRRRRPRARESRGPSRSRSRRTSLVDADGQVKLLDFGIATLIAAGRRTARPLTLERSAHAAICRAGTGGRRSQYDRDRRVCPWHPPSPVVRRTTSDGSPRRGVDIRRARRIDRRRSRRGRAMSRAGSPRTMPTAARDSRRTADIARPAPAGLSRRSRHHRRNGPRRNRLANGISRHGARRRHSAHRRSEPVLARADSTWYQLRRFAARHGSSWGRRRILSRSSPAPAIAVAQARALRARAGLGARAVAPRRGDQRFQQLPAVAGQPPRGKPISNAALLKQAESADRRRCSASRSRLRVHLQLRLAERYRSTSSSRTGGACCSAPTTIRALWATSVFAPRPPANGRCRSPSRRSQAGAGSDYGCAAHAPGEP